MLRIGFDVDGVLANFVRIYQQLFVKHTGIDLFKPGDIEDPPCWDWPQYRGYDAAAVKTVWGIIKTDPAFWMKLEPLPDASLLRMFIRQLERKHEVYYITSRVGDRVKRQSEMWLFEQLRYHFTVGPEVWPTVLISSDKGACAKALKLDVYVDDNMDNVNGCALKSPQTRTYLINRRYNALGAPTGDGNHLDAQHEHVIRVSGLGGVFDREEL